MRSRPVVAIDGPSGAGKSTVARSLAKRLDFSFVDTGALYRSIAMLADRDGTSWDDGARLAAIARSHTFSFDPDGNLSVDGVEIGDSIRTPRMSMGASVVAKHQELRSALLEIQRSLGEDGGAVLEGRDIGTVVFPDAEIKFFLHASVRVRARRRMIELETRGQIVSMEEVERDQEARDRADREREVSPLVRAEDSIDVPCDDLDVEEVVQFMFTMTKARFPLT
jgi:CMP/dCMP kinase